ncbi:hypothetical protein [Rubrivivax gelatinosus]|uniref:hypothetical protein n=1 Tax=Rubrivivax gelatinosus TaxID=28068 RepID=UPI0011D2479F|nr:hypothetical protein [Rubrivivax gelatinosus]
MSGSSVLVVLHGIWRPPRPAARRDPLWRAAAVASLLLVLALTALTALAVLPPPHPEARLFSDGWGAASFVEGEACAPDDPRAADVVRPKPPASATPVDRLALALRYLAWGLLLPLLLPLVLASRRVTARWPLATVVLLYGAAPAYFEWSANPAFVRLRQAVAEFWLERWPLQPEQFVLLDAAAAGVWLAAGIAAGAAVAGGVVAVARLADQSRHGVSRALLPLGVVLLVLGLTEASAAFLRGEGAALAMLPTLRAVALVCGAGVSLVLALRVAARAPTAGRRAAAWLICVLPVALALAHGWAMYFHWVSRYRV